jgi:hypothetical protein
MGTGCMAMVNQGTIGPDGNYHPLTDNFIPDPELEPKPKQPKRKSRRRKRTDPSIEQVAIARGIIRIVPVSSEANL